MSSTASSAKRLTATAHTGRRIKALCLCLLAAACATLPLTQAESTWREQFNVREADPIAMTGAGVAGAPDGFEEPDAMVFIKRHAKLRGALLASDIRFTDGEPSRSRLNLYATAPPYDNGRLRYLGSVAEGEFVGKPKSMVETNRGHFVVTDGLDLKDKVSDAVRAKQGIHVFDHDFKKLRSFGQGVFESVNGIAIDVNNRVYVTERSKGVVRRFGADGALDTRWQIADADVKKTDNMVIAERLTVGGVTGVLFLSDEERGMIRFYALENGRFLNVVLGNALSCAPQQGESADTCFRRQSVFTGNVEGMALHGDLLVVMDEADKPLPGKEDGGVLWFFDMRNQQMYNRPASWFAGQRERGLLGGIHKRSPHSQSKVEKNPQLATSIEGGTFISADGVDVTEVGGMRMLAVANQGLHRLELYDFNQLLATLKE